MDGDGKRVEGARITPRIHYKHRLGDFQGSYFRSYVTTDAAGRWRFDSVPASQDDVVVTIDHADFAPQEHLATRCEFGLDRGHKPTASIVLEHGMTVVGKVADETGKPIAGALARTWFHNTIRKAVTGADGSYQLRGCERAPARVVVSAKGRALDMREVRVEPGMEPVNFQMNPGGRVRVRVVDEQGKAIPKFHVLFQSWLGSTPVFEFDEINQEADDRGVWEWREATWDPFVADIICPGHAAVRSVALVAREDEYVLQAAPALIVSGRVVDRVTKDPVSRFLVRWGFQVSPRAAYWTHAASFATADGRYRVPTAQDHLDRKYIIQIEADGYEPAVSRAIRGNAGSITLDFELTKGQNFDGTVLTPELRPAAHAKVAASAGWHPPFQRINGDVDSRSWDWRETDAAGRIHFPPQGRDFELFITHASGYAIYHPTPKSNHRIIMLDPWTRVEGTYRVGGKPLAGIPIWISRRRGMGRSGDLRVFEWHRTTTGPRGRFVIERVIGGRGLIGRRFIWPANGGSAEISSTSRVEMGFPLGKTVHIDIEEKGRPVIGNAASASRNQTKARLAIRSR